MKSLALLSFLFAGCAVHAAEFGPRVQVPVASAADANRTFGRSMHLRVSGSAEEGFEVELVAPRRARDCYPNLVHWAPHGPDPSEVLPWHVAKRYFPNERTIPVCGQELAVEIRLVAPTVSLDGTRFTSGTLVVTAKHGKRVSGVGIR